MSAPLRASSSQTVDPEAMKRYTLGATGCMARRAPHRRAQPRVPAGPIVCLLLVLPLACVGSPAAAVQETRSARVRPRNGAELRSPGHEPRRGAPGFGSGTLTIVNTSAQDVVVQLVIPWRTGVPRPQPGKWSGLIGFSLPQYLPLWRLIYVRARSQVTIRNLRSMRSDRQTGHFDYTYHLLLATGNGWDNEELRFRSGEFLCRWDTRLLFTEKWDSHTMEYTVMQIVLPPDLRRTAGLREITEEEFFLELLSPGDGLYDPKGGARSR